VNELHDQARELLREGARTIRRHGWIQRESGDPERGFCAIGSLYRCYEENPCPLFVLELALDLLARDLPEVDSPYEGREYWKMKIAAWNDKAQPGAVSARMAELAEPSEAPDSVPEEWMSVVLS